MAHQLLAEGQKVGLLAVIDSYAPGYLKLLPWVERKIKQRFAFHLGNLRGLSCRDKLNYLLEKGRIAKQRIETGLKKAVSQIFLELGLPLPSMLKALQETSRGPKRFYIPKVYPGRITVFPPRYGPESHYHDLHMGWQELAAGGLDIHEIPGSFAFIIKEPHVQILAQKLRECLERAEVDTDAGKADTQSKGNDNSFLVATA